MKKLLFFFSTLFVFLIPHVSAEVDTPLHIDYRNPSSTPYIPNSVNAIKDTVCPSALCNELANQLGHSVTVYEYVEKVIQDFEDAGYHFLVVANYSTSLNVFGVNSAYYPSFTFYAINEDKTDLTDLSITLEYSKYGEYIYRLTDAGNINVFGWEGINLSDLERNVEILGNDNTFQSLLFIFDSNNSWNLKTSFLYYSNIDLNYNFIIDGVEYPITIFSDWFTDSSISISTGLGSATNKFLYMRNYIYEDNLFPPEEPSPEPDNPNQGIEDGLGDLNDSINSSDVNSSDYENFFSDFEDNNHGLLSFITAPLSFIQSLTNSTCTPITVPIPFVDTSVTLPCMTTIYQQYFGSFFTVYQMITNGIIAYWIGINCYRIVKNMKNPNSYYIEVMGL